MRVIVPFGATAPKTRLSGVLSVEERVAFAEAMLTDVLNALGALDDVRPTVLATADVDLPSSVVIDEQPLTDAVNTILETGDEPVAVVMADLALATPTVFRRLFAVDGDVVLAPGRGGGTNALVIRHPEFRVDYHGASIRDHRRIAEEIGASSTEFDSFRIATDIDEPDDLVEIVVHTDGAAKRWLKDAGFELATTDGRVKIVRNRRLREA